MKEEAPLGNPFIGEPRGGRPAHVAIAPPLCPKVMVVEVKRKVAEKKGGKGILAGRPSCGLHSPLPFIIHHILIP
jgi:hypothetical protein